MIILDLDFFVCKKKISGDITNNYKIIRFEKFKKNNLNFDKVCGIICRFDIFLNKNYLKKFKNLKFIATITTGTNHIDIDYLNNHNITLISLTKYRKFLNFIRATPEMTFMLIMIALRNLNFNNNYTFANLNNKTLIGSELYGKTLGIIGYGRVGKILSRYTYSFGAKNIHYDLSKANSKFSTYSNLSNLLKKSDIVSINLNLNDKNKNFFNLDYLKKMKKNAILINTSRGEILNENDLIYALENNIISKAALDVLCDENKGFSLILKKFKHLINKNKLIVTPHISGTTKESLEKTSDFIMEVLSKHLSKNYKK